MTFAAVRQRLADVEANIPGIRRAFVRRPRLIEPGDLPCFVNTPGASVYDLERFGEQMFDDVRRWTLRLYVAEVGADIEEKQEEACEVFIERVQAYLLARPGLELTSENAPRGLIYDTTFRGDSGPRRLAYVREYVGIEFTLDIADLKEITYADG